MKNENMTVTEWMLESLTSRGMFDQDAEKIIEQLKPQLEKSDHSMSERWNDKISNYVMPIKTVWSIWLDRVALEWIDENAPQHWARPMFL